MTKTYEHADDQAQPDRYLLRYALLGECRNRPVLTGYSFTRAGAVRAAADLRTARGADVLSVELVNARTREAEPWDGEEMA